MKYDICMDIAIIKQYVSSGKYVISRHADNERKADGLMIAEVKDALLTGEVLEQYSDTGRGESCLIVGFRGQVPIHIVCGWHGDRIVIITVYIPSPPKFGDPWTRGG